VFRVRGVACSVRILGLCRHDSQVTLLVQHSSRLRGQVPLPPAVRENILRRVARHLDHHRLREPLVTVDENAPFVLAAGRLLPFCVEADLDLHAQLAADRAQFNQALRIEFSRWISSPTDFSGWQRCRMDRKNSAGGAPALSEVSAFEHGEILRGQ